MVYSWNVSMVMEYGATSMAMRLAAFTCLFCGTMGWWS